MDPFLKTRIHRTLPDLGLGVCSPICICILHDTVRIIKVVGFHIQNFIVNDSSTSISNVAIISNSVRFIVPFPAAAPAISGKLCTGIITIEFCAFRQYCRCDSGNAANGFSNSLDTGICDDRLNNGGNCDSNR